jgi:hypothetical protein
MDIIIALKLALMGSVVLLVLVSTYFVFEGIRLVFRVRKLMDRLMFVTDVKEWMSFINLFRKSSRSKQ